MPLPGIVPPQRQFLLWCAHRFLGIPENPAEHLLDEMDWTSLLQTARLHGMIPAVYRAVNNSCQERLPQSFISQLRNHYYRNVKQTVVLTASLWELLDIFESHAISCIPFKGPLLSFYLYGDIAARQCYDMDVLVCRRDVLKAKDILISSGYIPQFNLNRPQQAALLNSESEISFTKRDGRIHLDLHWAVTRRWYSIPIDMEGLFERLQTIELDARIVRILSREDLLFLLCVHGAKHAWSRLAWICDIARLIAPMDIDWEELARKARKARAERILWLGLSLASELLLTSLPCDPKVKCLTAQVYADLFKENSRGEGLRTIVFQGKIRERPEDRVRPCLLQLIALNPLDMTFIALPQWLFPLYHLVRPIRLLIKYGRKLSGYLQRRWNLKHCFFQ